MRRLLILALILGLLTPLPAVAASPAMPGVGTPVYPASFHLSGQYTASKAGIIQFRMPYTARVLYVSAITQAKGGTQGTSTLTCKNGATNAFTDAMDLSGTAGTVIEAVLVSAYQSIAKDTVVICDLVITGGSNPTLDNISVVIWYQRRN
jgi:hypothetical protein